MRLRRANDFYGLPNIRLFVQLRSFMLGALQRFLGSYPWIAPGMLRGTGTFCRSAGYCLLLFSSLLGAWHIGSWSRGTPRDLPGEAPRQHQSAAEAAGLPAAREYAAGATMSNHGALPGKDWRKWVLVCMLVLISVPWWPNTLKCSRLPNSGSAGQLARTICS